MEPTNGRYTSTVLEQWGIACFFLSNYNTTYILATLVAVSRTKAPDGYHDGWDVLAGAAIGISSTYLFTKPYFKEHMDLGLAAGKDHYVLTFKYKF